MSVLAAILIVIGAFLTIGVAANVSSLHASDAAGNGLADAFAWFCAIAAWLVVLVLLLMCAARDGYPRYSGIGALLAFVLGIAGQVTALQILTGSKAEGAAATLLPIVTVAVPALFLARAAWGILPAVRTLAPGTAGAWAPLLLVILISLVPFAYRPKYAAERSAALASAAAARLENERQYKAKDEQRVQEILARIAALPVGSNLFQALEYCSDPDSRIRDAARAKARTFTHRQADAEDFLSQAHGATLRELPNLDVVLTPAMCQFARKALAEKGSLKPFDNDPIRIEDAETQVAPYVETMHWLGQKGCDCKAEIAAIEQAVRRFADSPRRQKLLADLSAVHSSFR
jgi:hypothetical protein